MSLSIAEMKAKQPGWVSDKTKAGEKHGKLRFRVWARDCAKGEDAPSLIVKEFTGDTESQVDDKIDAYKQKLWARFVAGRQATHNRKSPTISELLDHYLHECENPTQHDVDPVAEITLGGYYTAAEAVKKKLGPDTLLGNLTRLDIKRQLGEKRERSRQRIGVLRRAIDLAVSDGLYDGDNIAVMQRTRIRHKNRALRLAAKPERGIVPAADTAKLLEYVATLPDGAQWLPFYYLAWMAGPRTTDLFDFKRMDFDPVAGTLYANSKTDSGDRKIILSKTLVRMLRELEAWHVARGYQGYYLFPAQGGGRLNDSNFKKTILTRHLKAIGLTSKLVKGGAAVNDPERIRTSNGEKLPWTMYSFRHGVATMDEGHVPFHHIDAQLGHKNGVRVAHPNAADLPYFDAKNPALFDERRKSVDETERRRGWDVLPRAYRDRILRVVA